MTHHFDSTNVQGVTPLDTLVDRRWAAVLEPYTGAETGGLCQ